MKIAAGFVWLAGFLLLIMFLPGVSKPLLAWMSLLLTILLFIPYHTAQAKSLASDNGPMTDR